MFRYEVLMLAVPAMTQDEHANLEAQAQDVIAKAGASVISFERWGKFRLAYPVNRNDYGIYFLLRFEVKEEPKPVLDSIKRLLSVDQRNLVVRFVVNSLDLKAGLEYHRPPSLEETPQKEASASGRSEGRGRYEGRGGRSGGFNRTRWSRSENNEHSRGRQSYDAASQGKHETMAEQEVGGEIE